MGMLITFASPFLIIVKLRQPMNGQFPAAFQMQMVPARQAPGPAFQMQGAAPPMAMALPVMPHGMPQGNGPNRMLLAVPYPMSGMGMLPMVMGGSLCGIGLGPNLGTAGSLNPGGSQISSYLL